MRGTSLVVSMVLMVFAITGTAAVSEAGDGGTTVVAVGGGSVEDAWFQTGVMGDATFSFFAAYDKHGELKGSFFSKRVFPGGGARATMSTEITNLEVEQGECAWMMMEGVATFKATWVAKPIPDHTFTLEALDCDGQDDGADMVWFEVRRPNGNSRGAVSLDDFTEVDGGSIMILYPYNLP
ncbi:MAG: hypothetical protein P8Y85_08370, partial [Nitrospirota bacterium]